MLWNLSIAVSAGTLPVNLTVKALSCGIQTTVLAKEDPAPEELLSKLFSLLPDHFLEVVLAIPSMPRLEYLD